MKKYIIILVGLLFISCGSRKVTKSKIEEKKDSISIVVEKTEIKTSENTEINNNSKIDKTEDEFTIEPIDNSKEIIVNGKIYKNVKITHKKTKDNSLHINQKKVSKNALKQQLKHNKQTVTSSKVSNEKKIDKKESLVKYLYYIIIFIIVYLIYRYRKYVFGFINI